MNSISRAPSAERASHFGAFGLARELNAGWLERPYEAEVVSARWLSEARVYEAWGDGPTRETVVLGGSDLRDEPDSPES